MSSVDIFKKKLRWSETEGWFDGGGVGILAYAVVSEEFHVVSELLQMLKRDFKGDEYSRRLESRVRDEGYVSIGVPGGTTTLMAAMGFGSLEVVSILLASGANIQSVDVMGNDAFMFASMFGRPKNLECWLERVKDWDVNRKNTVIGGCALGCGVYIGANKLETVKILLDADASIDYRTFTGGTVLSNAVDNEDSDPNVVRLVLEKLKNSLCAKEFTSIVNYRIQASSAKWKILYFVSKVANRVTGLNSGMMYVISMWAGTTALNLAVVRGDIEIVKIFLSMVLIHMLRMTWV